jgi:uncharacterized membrane protein
MRTLMNRTLNLVAQTFVGLFILAADGIASTALGAGFMNSILQARSAALNAAQHAPLAPVTPGNAMYQFVTIDAPAAVTTLAGGINDTGLVSGPYIDANGNWHGYLWSDGKMITLDFPGTSVTALMSLSNAGVVIGYYGAAPSHAVLYDVRRKTWQLLPDIDNQPVNEGDGINNRGAGTGTACQGTFLAAGNCIGWTWNGSEYSFFDAPGADRATGGTVPSGINDLGKVAGFFSDSANFAHGFVKDGDDFSVVDVPGAADTYAADINDRDEIVGFDVHFDGTVHGFVERHGQFTTVDVPNSVATFILGNDSHGDIVGWWVDSNNLTHGFVAFKK